MMYTVCKAYFEYIKIKIRKIITSSLNMSIINGCVLSLLSNILLWNMFLHEIASVDINVTLVLVSIHGTT